jgi:hypothetical protein
MPLLRRFGQRDPDRDGKLSGDKREILEGLTSLEISQEEMNMAKPILVELQCLSVNDCGRLIRLTGRWNLWTVLLSRPKGCGLSEGCAPVTRAKPDSNRYALHAMARTKGLSSSNKCVCDYRGNPTGWSTGSAPECPSDGRVPIVAVKRGNSRGAKGDRISTVSRIANERTRPR